jgi:hypothetical protein
MTGFCPFNCVAVDTALALRKVDQAGALLLCPRDGALPGTGWLGEQGVRDIINTPHEPDSRELRGLDADEGGGWEISPAMPVVGSDSSSPDAIGGRWIACLIELQSSQVSLSSSLSPQS